MDDGEPQYMSQISRRELLAGTALGALTIGPNRILAAPVARRRSLRLAHLTDIHVKPETNAPHWMAVALKHVNSLRDKPSVLINGGDAIMDALAATPERTKVQWDLFKSILADNNGIPVQHVMGNHDVWGWQKSKSKATGEESNYGKNWALETLGLERSYRTFEQAGWKFVLLDSVFDRGGEAYDGQLDERQFAWLEAVLKSTPESTHVAIISHIPIISFTPLYFGNYVKDYRWNVPTALLHSDSKRLKDLFAKFKQVKVCLSGHIHLVDRVDYLGVTYLCNGAVSGSWWGGNHQETKPGYALVDFFDDGSVERQYVEYGWKPAA